jgi:hypothetical protein
MSRDSDRPLDATATDITTNYVILATAGLALVGIAYAILGSWLNVPFGFGEPWASHGGILEGLGSVWGIFAWAVGFTTLIGVILIVRRTPREYEPRELFGKGTWLSINAGFFEEILYRWLALFGVMILIKFVNIVTFGLVKWLYVSILIPFTNWASFGLLEPQLYGDHGWLLAAGIVSASIRFSDAHEYQGLLGRINAWYIGLFMFYLMFNYGLWAAIVAHILYDLCVFWVHGGLAYFQRPDRFRQVPLLSRQP